ncbi:MAG: AgmX/PglI C-terminal domain-containing protein [Myxococcota bacterium]
MLQLAEKAPTVTTQQVTRASQLPPSQNTSVSSLLTRLGTGGPAGLKDAITNIDAVPTKGGSNTAFDLAGRLAAGGSVQVARSGTGAVNTAGQVGDGVGQLSAGTRKGVRGKVTKLSSKMKVQGTLDPGEVTRVVNAHMGAIQACYEREMAKKPGLAGKIQFDWTITTTGTVRGVRVESSTMPSDIVANCIAAEIKTWRFARPSGGEARIKYPFAFRSG